ncbi:Crp/Fnr family transcriptional regulator [Bradyrhizobium diazoefficiens]|nr:Crp/Fnr family transcriptional regulator [Bradyrhizobium diazoefficiens]
MTQSFENRLLELFDPNDRDALIGQLEPVNLGYRQELYAAYRPIKWVYFLTSGVASLVNTMADGSTSEVGTIGNEGVVGLPILLGDRVAPTGACIQVPGSGLRMNALALQEELRRSNSMQSVMLRYAHAFFNQVAQTASCAHFHSIEQRCCRWFLMSLDRVQTEEFLLTQEFLGMMLGCRRSSVTEVAAALKDRRIIDYNRGHVTVLDRAELERCSCECYRLTKDEYDRLLGLPLGSNASQKARIA